MDEQIAKTFEDMEKLVFYEFSLNNLRDVFAKMKQREEEDRKFAIQLAMQEERCSFSDLSLIMVEALSSKVAMRNLLGNLRLKKWIESLQKKCMKKNKVN